MLSAESLACERGGRLLAKDLDFRVAPGTVLHVTGPNGAGKTSLLRVLAGMAQPAAGRLLWGDEDTATLGEDYFRALLYLGHHSAIKEELTPLENLRYALAWMGITATDDAERTALAALGLAGREHLPARYLSQGQKRRVALARLALAQSAPLWILDEPLAALDVHAIDTVVGLIAAHVAGGGMVVLTTHQDVRFATATVTQLALGS